jgi:4-amino-4-deoxy-L-arabinose transferase-like glycosyltransferase
MNKMKSYLKENLGNILIIIFLSMFVFLMIYNLTEQSLLTHIHWDSYEIQAESWLNGRVDVDNREFLELAIFEGKYYVSFPPLPSVILLPFVALFGRENVPNNLISVICSIITIIVSYRILKKKKAEDIFAIFLSLSIIFGSNLVSMRNEWRRMVYSTNNEYNVFNARRKCIIG